MSGIAGLRGTGNWGTDERPKSFRDNVLRFNPNGTAPIFALSANELDVFKDHFMQWNELVSVALVLFGGQKNLSRSHVDVGPPQG